MKTISEALEERDVFPRPIPLASTGLRDLDELTGGFLPGRAWIVAGTPGQGITTLLSHWAVSLAAAGVQTHLVSPREDASMVTARLLARVGRLSLGKLQSFDETLVSTDRYVRAREQLAELPLTLNYGDDSFHPQFVGWSAGARPTALLVDDADLVPGISPQTLGCYRTGGIASVIGLPHHVVFPDADTSANIEPDVDPQWARAADVVLRLRTRGLSGPPSFRPGEADLDVQLHRRGPTRTLGVAVQSHYSRYIDPPGEHR